MVNISTTKNGGSSSHSRHTGSSKSSTLNLNHQKKKKHTKKKMSIYSILLTIILLLIAIEIIAYTYINLPESNENSNEVETILQQHAHSQQQQQQQQQQSPILTPKQQRQNQNQKLRLENQKFHDKQLQYEKQQKELRQSIQKYDNSTLDERKKTSIKIQSMGISKEEYTLDEIPPWSQIISNFNAVTKENNDEPIILGLKEYCQDYRNKYKHDNNIATGPAGMFSTGTNLIAILMKTNCRSPSAERTRARGFNLIQVPWGKHNPADARTYRHRVTNPRIVGGNKNYDAVLPIVAIRHPYTWMTAMCRHSYQTRWKHVRDHCYESLYLQNPILKVPYGFKNYTTIDPTTGTNVTKNVTNSYKSLADMWVEWYKPYYLDTIYNNTPRIMVRHEDLVYRPKKVITSLCECVGGTIRSDGFQYKEDSANEGKGHGKHRSGLLTAIIKYGQPLEDWYSSYTSSDRKIMKSVFQGNDENENVNVQLMRTIYKTFQYKLYDDISNPIRNTGWEQKMNPILFPPT